MNAYETVFDVGWEQRTDITSKYAGDCANCKKHFSVGAKRSIFVLAPEGSVRKRKPFYIVTSCPECLDNVKQKIETVFKRFSEGNRTFYAYEVERAMREGDLLFTQG